MSSGVQAVRENRSRPAERLSLISLIVVYLVLHGAIAASIPAFEPATHNDDWVNALVVKQLCAEGRFRLHRLTGALAVPQILVGWAWCQMLGGFSFTALRTLMVLHGILPVVLLWRLLRQLNVGRTAAVCGALLFCVNPITVSLTWSFQSDLIYLSFVLGALLATLRADRLAGAQEQERDADLETGQTGCMESRSGQDSRPGTSENPSRESLPTSIVSCFLRTARKMPRSEAGVVLAASVLLLLAFLTRQSAIFVAAGIGFYWGLRRRWLWFASSLALILCMSFAEDWLIEQSELTYLPWVKERLLGSLGAWSVGRIVFCTFETLHALIFLGLLLLPLLLAAAPELLRASPRSEFIVTQDVALGGTRSGRVPPSCPRASFASQRWIGFLATTAVVGSVLLMDVPAHRTALLGNYIYVGRRCGIGPPTLEISADNPAGVARGGRYPVLRPLLGLAALAGGVLLFIALADAARRFLTAIRRWAGGPRLLIEVAFWASLAGTLATSVLIGRTPFDRYLLLLYPLALPLCLLSPAPRRRWAAVCVPAAVVLAVLSWGGVVDYWHWNHARWQALDWLTSQGVMPEQIDGGYEFNAIHDLLALPPELMNEQDRQRQAAIVAARRTRSTYRLCFAAGPTENVVAQFRYQTPLFQTPQQIYVVEDFPLAGSSPRRTESAR